MQQFVDKLEKSKQLTQKQESKANVYITRKKKSSKKKSSKKDNSKKITNDKPFWDQVNARTSIRKKSSKSKKRKSSNKKTTAKKDKSSNKKIRLITDNKSEKRVIKASKVPLEDYTELSSLAVRENEKKLQAIRKTQVKQEPRIRIKQEPVDDEGEETETDDDTN